MLHACFALESVVRMYSTFRTNSRSWPDTLEEYRPERRGQCWRNCPPHVLTCREGSRKLSLLTQLMHGCIGVGTGATPRPPICSPLPWVFTLAVGVVCCSPCRGASPLQWVWSVPPVCQKIMLTYRFLLPRFLGEGFVVICCAMLIAWDIQTL